MSIADLREWFIEKAGGYLAPGVEVIPSELAGHGMFLGVDSDSLSCGSELLSLPLSSCLSSEDPSVADLCVNDLFRVVELLCAELVKKEVSWWATYFATLSQKTGSWPEWRNDEYLLAEKGPPHFFEHAAKLMRGLPALYRTISNHIPGGAIASLDDKAPFRRALAIINSRKFGFTPDGKRKISACMPFGDMLNHSFTPNIIVGYDQSANRLRFVATRDIKPGEEFLHCYGEHDNLLLCTHFAFIVPDNPYGVEPHDGEALATTAENEDSIRDLLEALPPSIEDEALVLKTSSSAGCYAIAQWRLSYRKHLENRLSRVLSLDATKTDVHTIV